MRHAVLLAALLVGATACDTTTCDAPAGCLRAEMVSGTCTCQAWEVVSAHTVPLKFVVVAVTYGAIGNESQLTYGWTSPTSGLTPADSVLGSRLRLSVRDGDGREQIAAMVNGDVGLPAYAPLHPITAGSAGVLLAMGDGQSGSAWGFGTSYDAPGRARDEIQVWVNPTLTIETDASGQRTARWSWTSVGGCFWPLQLSCEGPHFTRMPVEVLDGTRPAGDPYTAQFVATLTPDEKAEILSYHPLYDPPGRDPASLASDPRFTRLGSASVGPGGASAPDTAWLPCQGTLGDADAALHALALPTLVTVEQPTLEHAVLSRDPACRTERPGMALATSTPGCDVSAEVYVDRAFGTLLFVPTSVAPACTRP